MTSYICRQKYSLALLDTMMKRYGNSIGVGFDIGCSLQSTVQDSILVGPLAKSSRLLILVNAFHSWAHNHLCQVYNHPLYVEGVEIEDLETMERLFSSSNTVAPCIHLATKYHWKQALDLHFCQWDEDKFVELGKYLLYIR